MSSSGRPWPLSELATADNKENRLKNEIESDSLIIREKSINYRFVETESD